MYLQDRDNISLLESALRRHFEIKSLYLTVLQQMPRFTFVLKKKNENINHTILNLLFFFFPKCTSKKKHPKSNKHYKFQSKQGQTLP